jgi:hypothetical protein
VPLDVSCAERALHHRMRLACEAAQAEGVAGRFRAWEQDGLLQRLNGRDYGGSRSSSSPV